MKAYEDLTPRGKLRRTRRIAQAALKAYGFTEAHLKFIVDTGNIVYRVKAMDPTPIDGNLYVDNCFSLRLHYPGYQDNNTVDSELEWLSAMCNEGLPVPQPICTTDGSLSVEVSVPGIPGARRCTLLRWVKGRMATKVVRPWHMTAIGRLLARFHNHTSRWKPSVGFVRRHYDSNGLWGDDTGTNYTADEVWPRIPPQHFKDFQEVTMRVKRVMDAWGKGPDVYGLIHADLGTKANVLFHGAKAHAIDFDDGGFGYWVYDLAMPLSDWEGEDVWPAFREALLEGYKEKRSIPEEQLCQLELFQAAVRAMEIFWGTAGIMLHPDSTYWMERRERAWKHIKRYLKENPL